MDLSQLPADLLPRAADWVEAQAERVARTGFPLNEMGLRLAREVGVTDPRKIRVAIVNEFPLPEAQELRDVAVKNCLIGPAMTGVTFDHSVLIRRGHDDVRLLSHEFRHVAQYEKYSSVEGFLFDYLWQIVFFGYQRAPLEQDARRYEIANKGKLNDFLVS